MILVALRGLLGRKLRTALTAIAILLGVAMIAGTYVLTDTVNESFSKIFHQADRTIDAVLTAKQPVQSEFGRPPSLPASLLAEVTATNGVDQAEGEVADTAQLFSSSGKTLGATPGAPTLLFSVPKPRFRRETLTAGHWPRGPEIGVDGATAKKQHLKVGDRVRIAGQGKVENVRIAGLTQFGNLGSIGGATLVAMDLATAQRLTNKQGRFDQIAVIAKSGVSPAIVVRRLRARVPPSLRGKVQIKTSEQYSTDQLAQLGQGLNFLTTALLAFAGIAVFVGAFIIFNTFSITVAQRARDFALLRTIGASRGQILRSVILEALAVGLVASIIGLLAGIGLARGLNSLFVAFGIDFPNAGEVVAPRTGIVALTVGTLVTLISALWPAIRATRTPPIAALREGSEVPRTRFSRFTPAVALVLTAVGAGLLAYGVLGSISDTSRRLIMIGLGAVVVFLGVALLSPKLVPPLAAVIGWPVERFTKISGRLARENAVRNPSRTAVTAAALMIGLALVGFVTIFAAELKKTSSDAVDRQVAGDLAVYNRGSLIPHGVRGAVAKVPGVARVASVTFDDAKLVGIGQNRVNGIEPGAGRLLHFQWKHGTDASLSAMKAHDVLIDANLARDHNLSLGSSLRVLTPAGKRDTFVVTGVYATSAILPTASFRYDTFVKDWNQHQDRMEIVGAVPGQNVKALKKRIDSSLQAQYPVASAHSQQDIKNQNAQSINQLLALIYVLLAMSVIVSLFGIINTLILSIYERTREIGMLRAIGMTRSQVRWIIRGESVITAVIGAILGLLLGIALAFVVTAGLADQGIEHTLPLGQLLIWVVFAIIFGVVAAAFPARRAARLDILQAVAQE